MKNSNNTFRAWALAAFLILLVNITFGQYQERSYDTKCGNISGSEFGRSIITTLDSGYAIAGIDDLINCGIAANDWMFLQLAKTGTHQSVKLFGTTGDDKCFSTVQVSNDSGYLLAGYMYETQKVGATLLKLNKSGSTMACRKIDDTLNSGYNQVTKDPGNYVANCGFLEKYFMAMSQKKPKKVLVSQYNPATAKTWAYRYDSYINDSTECKSSDIAVSICYQPNPVTNPKSYGVAIKTNKFTMAQDRWDIMIMKLDYTGAVIWNKIYRMTTNVDVPSTVPTRIIPMADGGFTVVGYTNAYGSTQTDIIVLRIDMNGNPIWSNTYAAGGYEVGLSIIEDNGFFVISGSGQGSGNPDALLMKIPVVGGVPLWTKLWDTGNTGSESAHDLVNSTFTGADGYAVTGDTRRGTQSFNPFFWRPDDNGEITGKDCQDSIFPQVLYNGHIIDTVILKRKTIKEKSFSPSVVNPTVFTNTHCVSLFSTLQPTEGDLDNPTDINEFETEMSYSLKQNYPNPFNPVTKIQYQIPFDGFVSIKVFDVAGKEVMTLVNENRQMGSYEVEFSGEKLSSGVYYYKLVSGNFTDIKRMILLK